MMNEILEKMIEECKYHMDFIYKHNNEDPEVKNFFLGKLVGLEELQRALKEEG